MDLHPEILFAWGSFGVPDEYISQKVGAICLPINYYAFKQIYGTDVGPLYIILANGVESRCGVRNCFQYLRKEHRAMLDLGCQVRSSGVNPNHIKLLRLHSAFNWWVIIRSTAYSVLFSDLSVALSAPIFSASILFDLLP